MENSNSSNNRTPDDLLHNNQNGNESSTEKEGSEPARSFTAKGSFNPSNNTINEQAPSQQSTYTTPPAPGSPLTNYQPMFEQSHDGNGVKIKHSGLGITSFIFSLLSVLLILIGIIVAAVNFTETALDQVQDLSYWDNLDMNTMPDWFISVMIGIFLIFASAFFAFIGAIFGVIGLIIKNRKKTFAIIGTILNGLILVGGFLLFVSGLFLG